MSYGSCSVVTIRASCDRQQHQAAPNDASQLELEVRLCLCFLPRQRRRRRRAGPVCVPTVLLADPDAAADGCCVVGRDELQASAEDIGREEFEASARRNVGREELEASATYVPTNIWGYYRRLFL